MTADESWTMQPSREETFTEFLERTCDGEESRREVEQKFRDTFREVIATLKEAHSVILDLKEQRDQANARFSSLLEIGPVAAERERCAKLAEAFSKIDPHGPRICIELAAAIRKGEPPS